ncbi:MAG: FAD-binding protein [Oscillospiraceae bacterium]
MKIINNESLSGYTTFHMGGNCKNIYFPESKEELIELASKKTDCRFIGGGSNLLINDSCEFDDVVCLREFSDELYVDSNGNVAASAAVRLQALINFINENGMGGIEYLFSVPGLVGGAIYMNAGRGKSFNCAISDYIISVEAMCVKDNAFGKRGDIVRMSKEDCGFSYRSSVFHNNEFLILSAVFSFPEMAKEESEKRRRERLELCRQKQDNSASNFGSVFCESDPRIMSLVKKLQLGKKNGIHFSGKTNNWLLNPEGKNAEKGSFDKTVALIERVKKMHKLLGKKCKEEVVIWK